MANDTRSRTLDLVLRSLCTDDLGGLCERHSIAPEKLAALRDAFVDAGIAAIEALDQTRSWFQVDVRFDALGFQWLLLLGGEFQDHVQRWIERGVVDQFCFVHKPPGARLRFRGERGVLLPELSALFARLVREGAITDWSRAVYDTEAYRFGGRTGMAITHRFFTVESLAVLAFHRERLRGGVTLEPMLFSLLLIDLLLRDVTDDEWERWDVWCRTEAAGRSLPLADQERATALEQSLATREALAGLLRDPERTIAGLSSPERRIVETYRNEVPAIARELRRARDRADLSLEMRAILSSWIVFHWNRMAFSLDDQRAIAFLATTASAPPVR